MFQHIILHMCVIDPVVRWLLSPQRPWTKFIGILLAVTVVVGVAGMQFKTARPSTHYHTLLVGPSASRGEIQAAFRRMSLKVHPDRNPSPTAEEDFKRISLAQEVLSDPMRRGNYDRYGDLNKEGKIGDSEVVDVLVFSICQIILPFVIIFIYTAGSEHAGLQRKIFTLYLALVFSLSLSLRLFPSPSHLSTLFPLPPPSSSSSITIAEDQQPKLTSINSSLSISSIYQFLSYYSLSPSSILSSSLLSIPFFPSLKLLSLLLSSPFSLLLPFEWLLLLHCLTPSAMDVVLIIIPQVRDYIEGEKRGVRRWVDGNAMRLYLSNLEILKALNHWLSQNKRSVVKGGSSDDILNIADVNECGNNGAQKEKSQENKKESFVVGGSGDGLLMETILNNCLYGTNETGVTDLIDIKLIKDTENKSLKKHLSSIIQEESTPPISSWINASTIRIAFILLLRVFKF